MFSKGRRVGGKLARLAAQPGTGLVGFASARKIGSAPRRNRARRRFREAVRLRADLIDPRLDYVAILSAAAAEASFEEIKREVGELFVEMSERWAGDLGSS